MTLLVFGHSGQLARALAGPDVITLPSARVDLMNRGAARSAIEAHRPRAVINAAAYTAVDRAETDEAAATALNADAPGEMARCCAALGIPLVHVSTDYVFSGAGDSPYRPLDPIGPLGTYGRTKAAGEAAVRAADGPHAILRTSWVFDGTGPNFVTTMLRLGAAGKPLRIVEDQIGGPTPARDLATACRKIATHLCDAPEATGTYHYAGAPDVSWKDFALAIFRTAGLSVPVTGIATSDWPTPAPRPLNSRLACGATRRVFRVERPQWQLALDTILAERDPR